MPEELLMPKNKSNNKKIISITLIALIVILTIILCVFIFVCSPVWIKGSSMYPTLQDGDMIMISKTNHSPALEDIVVYQKPNEDINVIKRVVGVAGNQFVFYEKDTIFDKNNPSFGTIKNLATNKEYPLSEEQYFSLINKYPNKTFTVGDNEMFTIGDNYSVSLDGRNYGCVNINRIIGIKI